MRSNLESRTNHVSFWVSIKPLSKGKVVHAVTSLILSQDISNISSFGGVVVAVQDLNPPSLYSSSSCHLYSILMHFRHCISCIAFLCIALHRTAIAYSSWHCVLLHCLLSPRNLLYRWNGKPFFLLTCITLHVTLRCVTLGNVTQCNVTSRYAFLFCYNTIHFVISI